jgi:hypothetical protein
MRRLAAFFTKWTLVASRRHFQKFNACFQMMLRAQDTLSIYGGHTGLRASGAELSIVVIEVTRWRNWQSTG